MDTTWKECIAALEAAGWSLTELGRVISLSPQSLSDIKQGRSNSPRGMAAVRLHNLHVTGAKPPSASSEAA